LAFVAGRCIRGSEVYVRVRMKRITCKHFFIKTDLPK
jgi:hypothetical protein